MALSGNLVRRILGGGIVSRSVECRKSFMRLKSTLTSPKLIISGVPPSTTDEKIREAFSPFGNLLKAEVVKDRASGRSMGFAIVTYDTIEDAEKARRQMNDSRLGYHVLFVESESDFSKEYVPPKTGCCLYFDVDDLDESEGALDLTTDDKLREAFAPFGNVLEARILKDGPYRNSKGLANVRYGTKEEAEKARDALENNRLGQTHSVTSYITSRTSG